MSLVGTVEHLEEHEIASGRPPFNALLRIQYEKRAFARVYFGSATYDEFTSAPEHDDVHRRTHVVFFDRLTVSKSKE